MSAASFMVGALPSPTKRSVAVVPFACLMLLNRPQAGVRPMAESTFAGLLALCAIYIGFNEGTDNWQAIWTCAIYLLLAITLWRARAAQSSSEPPSMMQAR